MLLLPKFIGGFSGVMVDSIGYAAFFMITASMGIPVIVLILLAMRYLPATKVNSGKSTV
jgi:PAT family beta-lactamase induction signal transducer AmpG